MTHGLALPSAVGPTLGQTLFTTPATTPPAQPCFSSSTWYGPALFCPLRPSITNQQCHFQPGPLHGAASSKGDSGGRGGGAEQGQRRIIRQTIENFSSCQNLAPPSWKKLHAPKYLYLDRKRFHRIWQGHMMSLHWSGSRDDKIKASREVGFSLEILRNLTLTMGGKGAGKCDSRH